MTKCAYFADPRAKLHDTGSGHPEHAARWHAALRGLADQSVSDAGGREADMEEMLLCHTLPYLTQAQQDVAAGYATLSTGDTDISPKSWQVAKLGTGLVLHAIDRVVAAKDGGQPGEQQRRAFCVVRPPGHHATADRGMGFCLLNNVAIAARYAQTKYGLDRILIADWDVHHGNGTQDIFYGDGSVFFCSTHQSPWYPGTGDVREKGEGAGGGTTLNFPLPASSGREQVLPAFGRLAKEMDTFRPDLVLISAGFDSLAGDPLGKFLLTTKDFIDLTNLLLEVADKYAGGRIVSVLEGGYSLDGLTSAVKAHAGALAAAT